MNPEDRLRDALSARAGSARTSPDALDGVFGRVARRRRNARLAAAGTALSVIAVSLVATAALRTPGGGDVVATAPTSPAVSGSATVSATASPTPPVPPPNRALVVLRLGRVVEVDTTTGAIVRDVVATKVPKAADVAWSPDRSRLVVQDGCILALYDAATGALEGDLGNGASPAFSPDGTRVVSTSCGDGNAVTVTPLGREGSRSYPAPELDDTKPVDTQQESLAQVHRAGWYDDDRIAVTREYEGAWETLLLDTRTDRRLADADPMGLSADYVAGDGASFVWSESCCYPEWEKPTKVMRMTGGRRPAKVVFEHPAVRDLAVDGLGQVLVVDDEGLWSWNGTGAPRLVVPDATAVGA
jgi:hypothetical protein